MANIHVREADVAIATLVAVLSHFLVATSLRGGDAVVLLAGTVSFYEADLHTMESPSQASIE